MTSLSAPATVSSPQLVSFEPRKGHAVRVTTIVRYALVGLFIANLGRIPIFSTGDRDAPILLNDVLVAVILGAGALSAVRRRSLQLDSVALFALAFAAVGGGSTLWSISRFGLTPFQVMVSLGYLARWLFYFGVYVVLINAMRSGDVEELWNALETVIMAVAAFGIVQALFLPNFAQLVYPNSRVRADWDPQGLVSTWLDPVFAGAFIMLGLVMQLARISVGERVARWKPVLLALAMVMTAARSALIATVVGVIVIISTRGLSKRMLRMSAGLLVLGAIAAPLVLLFTNLFLKLGVDPSGLQRVVAWLRAARVFADHPILGIGFNAWGFVQVHYGYTLQYVFSYSLDGGLIFIALMTGLVGLGLYLGMLTAVMRRARRIWRDATKPVAHRGIAIGVWASTVGLVVDSLFGNSLFAFLMETMWLLWALVFAASRDDVEVRGYPR